jgi:hypothetical protein
MTRGKIDDGWFNAGQEFEILGEPIHVNGQDWTPIVYDGEEDPDFIKTAAVKIIEN